LKRIRDSSEDNVSEFLSGCSVQAVRLLTDRETGARRGVAFVDFNTTEDVDKAMKLNGKKLNGSAVEMEWSVPKSGTPKQDKPAIFPSEKPEGCTTVCLKNLGDAVEKEIWEFLDGCEVQSIRVVYDRVSGASRGIAFADFSLTTGVDQAMQRNGNELKGNAVEMRYEAPKDRPRPEGCLTVAVKKLPAGALETDVRTLFKGLRSISDCRVICDKLMACTGLAFAEFTDPADAEAAVKRDGMSVLGQTVFICYETKQKKERESETRQKKEKESPILKHADEPAVEPKGHKQSCSVDADSPALDEATAPKSKRKVKRKVNEKRQGAEKERKKLRKKTKRSSAAPEHTDVAKESLPPIDDVDGISKIKKKKKKKRLEMDEPRAAMAAGDDASKVKKTKKRKTSLD